MAKIIYKNSKEKPLKSIKRIFPKKFKEGTSKEQEDVLSNTIKLYYGRSKIIGLFENKDIEPSDYPHNVKSGPEEFEPEKYDRVEESEPEEFEESIEERIKVS